jgi:transcriptional regulator with XRE-family HTH domain
MPRPKSRDPESDPIAALGEELERLRLAAGISTQDALARKVNFGREAITKVESGAEVPSDNLYQKWLEACRASDETRRFLDRMLADARRARSRLPQSIETWIGNEAKAVFLRLWGLLIIPAQLQTREYAHAMLLTTGKGEDWAAEQAGIRIGRQGTLDDPDPAHVTAVIHQHALHNLVGTPEVMIAQLEHLLDLSRQYNVHIQVVRDTGYFVGTDGAFEIASGDEIPDTLLMLNMREQATEDRALARTALAVFDEIRSYALSAEDSRALISEAIERWKTQQR